MMIAAGPSETQQFAGVLTPDSDLRQSLLGSGVMRHPAKQHLPQLMHIARRLAEYGITPGSNILDCFGGAGSAMLLCAPSNGGHNVVTIELSSHFRAIQAAAWEHFSCTIDMADVYKIPPGMFLSLAGDSREIPQVLAEAGMREGELLDSIITSPPYSDALHHNQVGAAIKRIRAERGASGTGQTSVPQTYDAIVTSPSYGGSEAVDRRDKQNATIAAHGGGNVSKSGYTIRMGEASHEQGYKHIDVHRGGKLRRDGYLDAVVTSPPYQASVGGPQERRSRAELKRREKGVANSAPCALIGNYSPDASNIGNERGNKYLASMAQVWQGAAAVLRPGGILVCITRDCVKDGKRVPVGDQNKALIEAAGLVHLERLTWKIDRLSFWRILQARKNPNAPIISEEFVDFFQQPLEVA